MTPAQIYLKETEKIIQLLDTQKIEELVDAICLLREQRGRLFLLGVGGSAANASHAVNDFRKIALVESYTPTDNVSEFSARINDEGWASAYAAWLRASRLSAGDAVFVLSVGGGDIQKGVSLNIVSALRFAKEVGAKIFAIVGRDGGFTKSIADLCLLIPTVNDVRVTFHAETFQSVLLHLLVSHPKLKQAPTKWEELQR